MSDGRLLRDAVDALAAEASGRLGAADRPLVDGVRAYLAQELAVAVVGRVSSGKSTLVNAMVGAQVAATDATDCTQVVTWLRFGRHPAAHMVLQNGAEEPLLISTAGALPARLPVPVEEVQRIELRDPSEALRRTTLVDTPGLASARTDLSQRTIDFMAAASDSEAQRADAILFVFTGSLKADEAAAVDLFLGGGSAAEVAGTIGVLTKADTVGDDDPMATAAALADAMAAEHTRLFSGVVSVSGLLSETVRCGRLRESHARMLSDLAGQWPEDQAELACSDADLFCSMDASVGPQERSELLRLLGLYGVRKCMAEAREGRGRAHQMNSMLGRLAGFARLESVLQTEVARRVDALKARRAVTALSDIGYGLHPAQEAAPDAATEEARQWLRLRLQELLDSAAMHPLVLLEAAHQVNSGRVALPEILEEDLRRLVAALPEPPDPEPALAAIERWRGFALLAAPPQRRVADAAVRAWELSLLPGRP